MSQTNDTNTDVPDRHQEAYHYLSGLMDEAEDALGLEPVNEEKLREALQDAEDLLFDLDQIEYQLIYELERAEEDIIGNSPK